MLAGSSPNTVCSCGRKRLCCPALSLADCTLCLEFTGIPYLLSLGSRPASVHPIHHM
jgi:hypothetical protein